MKRTDNLIYRIDWLTVLLYFLVVFLGWMNIYASVYEEGLNQSIFDFSLNSGRQLVWIAVSLLIIIPILTVDFKIYETFAYIIFGIMILMLIIVLFVGTEVAGSKSWIYIGSLGFQPSEFTKFATALALAKYLQDNNTKVNNIKNLAILTLIVAMPMSLIILQGDAGTALIFSAFILVLYREGLTPVFLIISFSLVTIFLLTLLINHLYLLISIIVLSIIFIVFSKKTFKRIAGIITVSILIFGMIKGVDYAFTNLLKTHQQNRIKVLINPDLDPLGAGWNVTQSKIAIGSGGFWGKGFLNGTQTKFDFVPEQSTDFIFCTLAEEHGFIGSFTVISLFLILLLRIIKIAERQKTRFARVYAYGVASILFFHIGINIGMTIGLFPVIGIPLPFLSYGGSSLWSFTILLFVLIKLDAHRMDLLLR